MICAIVIRQHDGFQSYLVLEADNPRELLRHWGFPEEFSIRPWLGSLDPVDAMEEWAEMLGEDLENYMVTDETNEVYRTELSYWDNCRMWPEKPSP